MKLEIWPNSPESTVVTDDSLCTLPCMDGCDLKPGPKCPTIVFSDEVGEEGIGRLRYIYEPIKPVMKPSTRGRIGRTYRFTKENY